MSSRVSDRLLELRRRRFVGRAAERSLFESVLASPQLRWQVLYIFGPGGVGKTTLLREFAYMCDRAKTPAVYLDARNIEPLPEAFSSTLQSATGVTTQDSLFDKISASDSHYVIFIDTFSQIQTLFYIKLFGHCVATPGLAFIFSTLAEPDFWEWFCQVSIFHGRGPVVQWFPTPKT